MRIHQLKLQRGGEPSEPYQPERRRAIVGQAEREEILRALGIPLKRHCQCSEREQYCENSDWIMSSDDILTDYEMATFDGLQNVSSQCSSTSWETLAYRETSETTALFWVEWPLKKKTHPVDVKVTSKTTDFGGSISDASKQLFPNECSY